MSIFEGFFNFLFSDEKQLSQKAAVVVLVILGVIIIDNLLGFTYYYNTEKKIQQVGELNDIIKDSTIDIHTKNYAVGLRSEIINRTNYFSTGVAFFRKLNTNDKTETVAVAKSSIKKVNQPNERNNYWFHITSGGLFYLLAILILVIMPFTDISTSIIQKVATCLLTGVIIAALGLFFYWICNLIPQISDKTWGWNYGINILIQSSIFVISAILNKKKKANNK